MTDTAQNSMSDTFAAMPDTLTARQAFISNAKQQSLAWPRLPLWTSRVIHHVEVWNATDKNGRPDPHRFVYAAIMLDLNTSAPWSQKLTVVPIATRGRLYDKAFLYCRPCVGPRAGCSGRATLSQYVGFGKNPRAGFPGFLLREYPVRVRRLTLCSESDCGFCNDNGHRLAGFRSAGVR